MNLKNRKARKAQLITSLRRRYQVYQFNGLGQCTLSRPGSAAKGEASCVEVRVPESIGYALLTKG